MNMKTEQIRLLRPGEFEAAAELADRVFRDAEHKSMGDAFPNAFSPALQQSYGAFAEGKLVSFVGFVPSVIRIGEAELNVYSIGAVCTDPDYRGRGYVGTILDMIREHSRRARAPLILVSGNRGIYERFGCRTFGSLTSFNASRQSFDKLSGATDGEETYRPFDRADWFALRKLSRSRYVGYEQSIWDLAAAIYAEPTASNSKLKHRVWVAERGGTPFAFAVLAVAGDIAPLGKPRLIEWAGDAAAAVRLAAYGARAEGAESLQFVVPWQDGGMERVLAESGCPAVTGKLTGTVAVVDAGELLRQLTPYLKRKDEAALSRLQLSTNEDGRHFAEWDGVSAELQPEELISLLFDPVRIESAVPGPASEAASRLFPVPLPLPSGLNFV